MPFALHYHHTEAMRSVLNVQLLHLVLLILPYVMSNHVAAAFSLTGSSEYSTVDPEQCSNLKNSVDTSVVLEHRRLRDDEFWRENDMFDVDRKTFLDHKWQTTHSLCGDKSKLVHFLSKLAPEGFVHEVEKTLAVSPMSIRVTPYVLSLINWEDPWSDPIRRECIPIREEITPNHPMLMFDSLFEQGDTPVKGLTHRYPDKVLFLALDTCPLYCRFCTRSYVIGPDTECVKKFDIRANQARWDRVFNYIESSPNVEDVVISGGDTFNLHANHIKAIGERLLKMSNIRRIRFATRGPAVMPMKLLTDKKWVQALTEVHEYGRRLRKHVCLHTHFNHPNMITSITRDAVDVLFQRGITVRNQSVLLHNVNDTPDTAILLAKRLAEINIHPYYVYQHDMVPGSEFMRTSVQTALNLEKHVRGTTAGFNSPLYVVDLPGGGGKRDVHSFEHYNRKSGISVYQAPSVKKSRYFMYFDPLHSLSEEIQHAWTDKCERQKMIDAALEEAKSNTNLVETNQHF